MMWEGRSDDLSILDQEALYRRVFDDGPNMIAIDTVTGVRRPTSGVFQPDRDGVSVYRESKLRDVGLGPQDVKISASNRVVSVRAGEVRALDSLGVVDDPWPRDIPDACHQRNGAHALIAGWDGLGTGARRRHQRQLARWAVFLDD